MYGKLRKITEVWGIAERVKRPFKKNYEFVHLLSGGVEKLVVEM